MHRGFSDKFSGPRRPTFHNPSYNKRRQDQ